MNILKLCLKNLMAYHMAARTSEDRSGPLVTCTGNLCQSTGTSSPVSTGDLPVLPVQVTNGPDRSSLFLYFFTAWNAGLTETVLNGSQHGDQSYLVH